MAEHTPGEWKAEEDGSGQWKVRSYRQDRVMRIATCPHTHSARDHREEMEANARLIAAAPETAAERDRLREVLCLARPYVVAAVEQIAHADESEPQSDLAIIDIALASQKENSGE